MKEQKEIKYETEP